MSNLYTKDLYLQGAVLKKDKSLADFSAFTTVKVAQPSVADVYAPSTEEKKIVSTVGYVDALLAGAKFTKDATVDLSSFASGIKAVTPVVSAPHAPAESMKNQVVNVDYISKTLNSANFTTSKADLSGFTGGVKAVTPQTVSLLDTPSTTVKNDVVTIEYVNSALNDALVTTIDGNKVSRVARLETRFNTFMEAESTNDQQVNTLTELLNLVNSLSGNQSSDLIATFNSVSNRIANFENFLGQNQASIEYATETSWPAVSKLTTDATFQLSQPTGRGFPVIYVDGVAQSTVYALVGTSSLVSSVSSAGLVTLASPAVAGTFRVSATNSVRTVTTIVTIAAPSTGATGAGVTGATGAGVTGATGAGVTGATGAGVTGAGVTGMGGGSSWSLAPKNLGDPDFQITAPSGLTGVVITDYTYIVEGGTVSGNTTSNAVVSIRNDGLVHLVGGSGMATIKVKLTDGSFPYSAMLMVMNPFMIQPKYSDDIYTYQLTAPAALSNQVAGTNYKYVNASNASYFTITDTGNITINSATGSAAINIVSIPAGTVLYSATFNVTENPWPSLTSKQYQIGTFQLSRPTSMSTGNAPIYSTSGPYFTISGDIVTIASNIPTDSLPVTQMITAMQGSLVVSGFQRLTG